LSFFNEDKIGTLLPHDDALVVTLKIGGYDVKRELVVQATVQRSCTLTYLGG